MSHMIINVATPIRPIFAVVSGTWVEREDLDDHEHGWQFSPKRTTNELAELNPWEVRDKFLRLRHDDRDALRTFLWTTGSFCWLDHRPIAESELWQFQAVIREQLLNPRVSENRTRRATELENIIHNRIQRHVLNINVGFEDGSLVGEAEAINTFDAILSTIFLDRLKNLRFKVCQRPDCAAIYELTSRHNRKFCSYDCAHLMTVRRSRTGKKRRYKTVRS
jgi:hypothetical protein